MSLHYLVKLRMLIAHSRTCYHIELLKKLEKLSYLNYGIKIRQI